jgi:hypothetical protein
VDRMILYFWQSCKCGVSGYAWRGDFVERWKGDIRLDHVRMAPMSCHFDPAEIEYRLCTPAEVKEQEPETPMSLFTSGAVRT